MLRRVQAGAKARRQMADRHILKILARNKCVVDICACPGNNITNTHTHTHTQHRQQVCENIWASRIVAVKISYWRRVGGDLREQLWTENCLI